MRIILILFTFLISFHLAYSEIITLKSGKIIDAPILERKEDYIKVDISGIGIKYYRDEITSIEGVLLGQDKEKTNFTQSTSINSSAFSGIDRERIRRILKRLEYPEHAWPDLEKMLVAFLVKIDFSLLKQKADLAKINLEQLKDFVSEVGTLIEREGYLNYRQPLLLSKLLITSLYNENALNLMESVSVELEGEQILFACSAVTQLGAIVLDLLDINSTVANSPDHVFNCILFDNRKVLFVDFLNKVFEIVDIDQYYKLKGGYLVLKEKYQIPFGGRQKIKERLKIGGRLNSLKEIINHLYSSIRITDIHGATSSVYVNIANAYHQQGDYNQAIIYCNHALKINPSFVEAYVNRGASYKQQGDLNQAIADYSQALMINPNHASAYNNRGNIHYYQGDYTKAITDYSQALRMNPNFTKACYSRALAYFYQGDYAKSWEDVRKAQILGYQVNPQFIQELRRASGKVKGDGVN